MSTQNNNTNNNTGDGGDSTAKNAMAYKLTSDEYLRAALRLSADGVHVFAIEAANAAIRHYEDNPACYLVLGSCFEAKYNAAVKAAEAAGKPGEPVDARRDKAEAIKAYEISLDKMWIQPQLASEEAIAEIEAKLVGLGIEQSEAQRRTLEARLAVAERYVSHKGADIFLCCRD